MVSPGIAEVIVTTALPTLKVFLLALSFFADTEVGQTGE